MNQIFSVYKDKIIKKYGFIDLSYYSSGSDCQERERLENTAVDEIFVEVDFREYKNKRTTYFHGMLSDNGDKIILSGPGSGKTTFFKKMMCVKIEQNLIPVYWDWKSLYELIRDEIELETILFDYFNDYLKNDFDRDDIESFIDKSQFVFFIDRFDKVKLCEGIPVLNKIIATPNIENQDNCQRNLFIIASRIAKFSDKEYQSLKDSGFDFFQIIPFTDFSLHRYIEKYVRLIFSSTDELKIPEIISELVSYIEKWPRVKKLASNPLFLNQIISIRKIEHCLPSTELNLYRKCVEMMLQDWKNTEANKMKYEHLRLSDDEIIDNLLNETAYEYFNKFINEKIDEFGILSEKELKEILTKIYQEITEKDRNAAEVKTCVEDMFSYFKDDLGVLVEKFKGQFGFSHFLLLEYLAAQYLKKKYSQKEKFEDYILEIIKNPRFKNVEGTIIFQIELFDSVSPKFIDKLAKKLLELYKEQKNENILVLLAKLLKDSDGLSLEYTGEILSQLVILKSEYPENLEIHEIIGEIYRFSKAFKEDFDLLINKLNVEKESFMVFSEKATQWTGGKAKGIKDFIKNELPCPPSEIKATVEKLKKQLDLVEKIMERYEKLKCKNEINFSRFKINELMNDIIFYLKQQPQFKGIEIIYLPNQNGENVVSIDKCRIIQVIEELVDNSLRHSKADIEKVKIELSAQCSGTKFLIHYQDNGRGILKEDKDRIFDFFYSEANEECVGIGLGCVKRNIEAIGGKIEEIGNENEGVHFKIKFVNKNIDTKMVMH